MELNFSLKKAWSDLTQNKKYIWYLLDISFVLIILSILESAFNFKGLSTVANLFVVAFFTLLNNNIIQGQEPVMENVFSYQKGQRSIFRIMIKLIVMRLSYFVPFVLIVATLFFVSKNVFMLDKLQSFFVILLPLLPIVIFFSVFLPLLFSENLRLKDAYNLKKAFLLFKLCWKDYLKAILIYFLMLLCLLVVCILIGLVLTGIAILFSLLAMKFGVAAIDLMVFKNFVKIIAEIIFSGILANIGVVVISYMDSQIFSQTYKYSLSKLNVD